MDNIIAIAIMMSAIRYLCNAVDADDTTMFKLLCRIVVVATVVVGLCNTISGIV